MSIHISAEATCDNCGTTAPCKLDCCFAGGFSQGSHTFEKAFVLPRDLGGWFLWNMLMACSVACRDALSKRPPRSEYGGDWTALG